MTFETITDAVNVADIRLLAVFVEFIAQHIDVRANRCRRNIRALFPHAVKQSLGAEYLVGIAHEKFEHGKFLL